MPVLVLTGEKASGPFLIEQARLVATRVQGIVVAGSGHWLIDEAPSQVIPAIVTFVNGSEASGQRLVPAEMAALGKAGARGGHVRRHRHRDERHEGRSHAAGLYTILLRVPANTKIEAHDHPDDRIATVVSGTWYFGYGDAFDERKLRALPAGSFYTEPPDRAALRTHRRGSGVVLQITGVGPTGTTSRSSVAQR